MKPPLVSVVIATYNASHLLRYAIESVRLSDYRHFEIIVVGDHCTDDTEAVVASFGDERIRFINLKRNSGQQATPNNVGVAAARGEYLSFLNQDDMYLPHHLSSSLAMIRRMGADILCSAYPAILPAPPAGSGSSEIDAIGQGFEPTGRFSPHTFHVASSWFMRREATRKAGNWKLENQMWATPSQDWLYRAWRKGLRIQCTRQMSVIVLHAGYRRNSYRKRDSSEHKTVFRDIVSTNRLRTQVLLAAEDWFEAILHPPQIFKEPDGWLDGVLLGKQWGRTRKERKRFDFLHYDQIIIWILTRIGIHPNSAYIIKHFGWRRGELIRIQQRTIGLERVIE